MLELLLQHVVDRLLTPGTKTDIHGGTQEKSTMGKKTSPRPYRNKILETTKIPPGHSTAAGYWSGNNSTPSDERLILYLIPGTRHLNVNSSDLREIVVKT